MKSEARGQRSDIQGYDPRDFPISQLRSPISHLLLPISHLPSSISLLRPRRRKAFALVAVVIVVAVLTIMSVAFMQSMRIDRLTARAYLNKTRAEMAAEAGVETAIQRLVGAMEAGTYHASGYYDLTPSDDSDVPIPVIYASPDYGGDPQAPLPYPLLSIDRPQTDPASLNPADWVEMNIRESASDTVGWMGSPVDASGNVQFRSQKAPWMELRADSSLPEQPDPDQPNYNPVVARVAFYIVDESSKLNYRVAGNADGAGGAFARSQADPALIANLDVGALPLVNGQPLSSADAALNRSIIEFYRDLGAGLIDPGAIVRSTSALASDVYDRIKFYGTVFSKSNELAGTGRPRVNLNAIVTSDRDPGNPPDNTFFPEDIASDLDDIIYVITGRHVFDAADREESTSLFFNEPDLAEEDQPMPDFGQRFYPVTTPPMNPDHANKYLLRIAANIRDYIDTDSQPTYVDVDGYVESYNPEDNYDIANQFALETGEEPSALGKEAVPYFYEHLWRGREANWRDRGSDAIGIVYIEHYFEFYNPSTKDWTAPAGTKLRIYNLPFWTVTDESEGLTWEQPYAEVTLDVSGKVFKAGRATVVTTDSSPPAALLTNLTVDDNLHIITPDEGTNATRWRLTTTDDVSGVFGAKLQGRRNGSPGNTTTDYETRFVWGTENGYLDSHPYIAISIWTGPPVNQSVPPWNFKGEYVGDDTRWYYSSSLAGSSGTVRSGDPQSVAEQLRYKGYTGGFSSDPNQTRFYGNEQQAELTGEHTLGRAFSQFVNPQGWPDATPLLDDTNRTAYAVVRDGPMQSIGELGHIYDPHRSSANVLYSRGGGRTLEMGRRGDIVTDQRFQGQWENKAWRLCDLFGVHPDGGKRFLDPTAEGKININGVFRDNGLALKAALREFTFLSSPDSAPTTNGADLREGEIDSIVASMIAYLRSEQSAGRPPVFMERGEVSEIDYFNQNSNTLANQALNTLNDRAREEVYRRISELVTTRSSTYSIYVIADAINQRQDGAKVPYSRARKKVIVDVNPVVAEDSYEKLSGYSTERVYETN